MPQPGNAGWKRFRHNWSPEPASARDVPGEPAPTSGRAWATGPPVPAPLTSGAWAAAPAAPAGSAGPATAAAATTTAMTIFRTTRPALRLPFLPARLTFDR